MRSVVHGFNTECTEHLRELCVKAFSTEGTESLLTRGEVFAAQEETELEGLRVWRRHRYSKGYCVRATAIFASTAERVEPSVCSSDSLGMLLTKGPTIHPRPVGISRVSEIDSHST